MIIILALLTEKIAELTLAVSLLAASVPTVAKAEQEPISPHEEAILRILTPNESKVATVRSYAEQYGADPDLAVAIVHCESNFEQYAKNKDSSAESYFQFLDGTWRRTLERMGLPTTTSKFAMPYAMTVGAWLLKTDGTRHWEESRKCWEHEIS